MLFRSRIFGALRNIHVRLLLLSFTLRLSALYLGSAPHLCSEPECYGNLIQMKTDTVHSPQHCMTCEQVGSSTYLVTYHTLQLLSSIAILGQQRFCCCRPRRCRNAAEPGFLAEPSGGAQREARISAADSGMKPAIEEIDRLEAGARA